jgi:hypothetical protein
VPRIQPEVLLEGLSSDVPREKFGAAKALKRLSEKSPAVLYPYFDVFVTLLANENSILRWSAMLILGNLARVDHAGKLEPMIGDYLAPIAGPPLIDAAETIRGATAIAMAKPHLANTIVERILSVEQATYATDECRNVAIGHAINALDEMYELARERRSIQQFVSRQANNPRPSTRKKAERFLRRHARTDAATAR